MNTMNMAPAEAVRLCIKVSQPASLIGASTREVGLTVKAIGPNNHRIVEVGCVELSDRRPTGRVFHRYVNPQRDVSAEAFAVDGLSAEFLADKPLFSEIAEEFLAFVGDAPLIAEDMTSGLGLINAELECCGLPLIPRSRQSDTFRLIMKKPFRDGSRPDVKSVAEAAVDRLTASPAPSVAEKRIAITELLRRHQKKTNGAVAAMIGVDPATVGKVRREMIGRGEIADYPVRNGIDGRIYPARKPRRRKPTDPDLRRLFRSWNAASPSVRAVFLASVGLTAGEIEAS